MKAGKARVLLIILFLFSFLISLGVNKNAWASGVSGYAVEGNIPMFSFEEPVKLQVKVFDSNHSEINNARVVFEISPALAPPPYIHDKEMGFMNKILSGETNDPETQEYLRYLKNLKVNHEKSIQKIASFDPSTGYYTATYIFSRFPWGIEVYITGPEGYFQKANCFFPHRAHCAYIDVTNIELAKTYFHQLEYAAEKNDWQTVEQKINLINASLNGKHGMYYMLRTHHGKDISKFEQQMTQLQENVSQKLGNAVIATVEEMLETLQEYENYFGVIETNQDPVKNNPDCYQIKVWDNINQKGITNALVIIQDSFNIEEEVKNPAIVSFQPPEQGMYHAKIAYIPNGILAKELGNGRYVFESKSFKSNGSPKRIFIYYFLDMSGIPSKFITQEISLKFKN